MGRTGLRPVKRKKTRVAESRERLDQLKSRGELPLVLRGRRFTYRGLLTIASLTDKHFEQGRTKISEEVCKALGWRQPNGWLKDRACRDVLRRLATKRIIALPPRLTKHKKVMPNCQAVETDNRSFNRSLLEKELVPVNKMPGSLTFELAKGNSAERLWNALVAEHHYLGHRVQVGRCLKYLVKGDGILLGAISFSSPAWNLSSRDAVLGRLGLRGKKARDLVVNNSRFCIAPTVQVPHLASRILAQAAKRISVDWLEYYSIKPVIAETFVEPKRFAGTCYRAANWMEIGSTSGYAKVGSSHHNSQEPKRVFLYGLSRDYRRRLANELAWRGAP